MFYHTQLQNLTMDILTGGQMLGSWVCLQASKWFVRTLSYPLPSLSRPLAPRLPLLVQLCRSRGGVEVHLPLLASAVRHEAEPKSGNPRGNGDRLGLRVDRIGLGTKIVCRDWGWGGHKWANSSWFGSRMTLVQLKLLLALFEAIWAESINFTK